MFQQDKSFNDHYKVGTQLGSGAFSQVYKCRENKTNTEYAAKIVSRNQPLPGSRNRELMFDVEIRINQKLNHENIVNLHEIYTIPKLTLIFDLVTGGELFDDIERRSCYSEADSAACIREVLNGVSYIHSQKVIHRDLKPENLLLTSDKRIKIADFGLAVEFNTDEDLIFGTAGSPDYIAPEILNKHYYNKKVDIWSCGVILYILLCGYPPFETRDDQKQGQFKFYAEDWHGIDVEARTLIVRMLTVNQKQRIDAEQALNSTWLAEYDKRNKEHRAKTIAKIKQFNAKRKFKGGVNAIMAANRMANLNSLVGSASNANNTSSPNSKSGSIGSGGVAQPNSHPSANHGSVSSSQNPSNIQQQSSQRSNNHAPSAHHQSHHSNTQNSPVAVNNLSSQMNNLNMNQQTSSSTNRTNSHSNEKSQTKSSSSPSSKSKDKKDKKKKKWFFF